MTRSCGKFNIWFETIPTNQMLNLIKENMKFNLLKIFTVLAFSFLYVLTANAQSNNSKQTENKLLNDRPLEITEKEPPRTAIFGQCFRQYGFDYLKIAVRVTFDISEKVTDVEIIKESGCKDFDEESIRVARKIKFKPAVKDGKLITVTKIVMYVGGIR